MVGLLIGFTYLEGKRPLPGCFIDLYRVYVFLTKLGFVDIHVITDVTTDPSSYHYQRAIRNGEVDANILSFVSDLKKKHRHHDIQTKEDLAKKISSILKGVKEGVIYLTGHGTKTGFLCPRNLILWECLQANIFSSTQQDSKILMILDTCHGYSFCLPYQLKGEFARFEFIGTSFYPQCNFLLLATQGDEAAATNIGSLGTKSIISRLEAGISEYFLLRQKVEEDLSSTETLRSMHLKLGVYASHPNLYCLWEWLRYRKAFLSYSKCLFIRL